MSNHIKNVSPAIFVIALQITLTSITAIAGIFEIKSLAQACAIAGPMIFVVSPLLIILQRLMSDSKIVGLVALLVLTVVAIIPWSSFFYMNKLLAGADFDQFRALFTAVFVATTNGLDHEIGYNWTIAIVAMTNSTAFVVFLGFLIYFLPRLDGKDRS